MHAAQPYADGITEVVRDLQAAGAGANNPLLVPRDETRAGRRGRASPPTAACAAGTTRRDPRRRGRRSARTQAPGRETAIVTVGRKPEGYFRFRNFPIDASLGGLHAEPDLRGRPRGRGSRSRAVRGRRARPRAAHVHASSSPPAARKSSYRAAAAAAERRGRTRRARAGASTASRRGAYEFEPDPKPSSTRCCRATREARIYAALLNAAASEHAARQRAMKAATDNADELIRALSRVHEPRPPGHDHHRDHGDRRRRRGAARPTAATDDEHERFDFGGVRAALTASHTGH